MHQQVCVNPCMHNQLHAWHHNRCHTVYQIMQRQLARIASSKCTHSSGMQDRRGHSPFSRSRCSERARLLRSCDLPRWRSPETPASLSDFTRSAFARSLHAMHARVRPTGGVGRSEEEGETCRQHLRVACSCWQAQQLQVVARTSRPVPSSLCRASRDSWPRRPACMQRHTHFRDFGASPKHSLEPAASCRGLGHP